MFDVMKIRKDFPMFKNNEYMQGKKMIYFDNANTSFKPQCVMDAINEYYCYYSSICSPCSPTITAPTAFHARVAHLTRAGNLATPE